MITPKAQGKTSVVVKEANGNKTVTINIEVKSTAITATNTNVTAYVGGADQTVTISGTNAGAFSIQTVEQMQEHLVYKQDQILLMQQQV